MGPISIFAAPRRGRKVDLDTLPASTNPYLNCRQTAVIRIAHATDRRSAAGSVRRVADASGYLPRYFEKIIEDNGMPSTSP